MLALRILTAIVLLPPVVAALLWGPRQLLLLLSLVVFLIINFEFYSVAFRDSLPRRIQWTLLSAIIPFSYLAYGFAGLSAGFVLSSMLALLLLILRTETEEHEPPFQDMLPAVFVGLAYPGVLGAMLVVAANSIPGGHILWLLLVVICTDSFAYFGGRTIGGPKCTPRISPNKTSSGMLCGILGAAAGSMALGYLLGFDKSLLELFLYGILVGVLAVCGDLAESLVKRTYEVKDIGMLLPGHGGLFDRLDAFLFTVPVLFVFG